MSDDSPFYSPTHQPPPPRQPRPGETIWTLVKGVQHYVAQVRDHTGVDAGVELQLLQDGELIVGWRFPTRAAAIAQADGICEDFITQGWARKERTR